MVIKFQEVMVGLAWTEHLSVGNAIIDSDHKKLIAMVNGAVYMINKGDDFALSQAIDQIEHWVNVHFSNEKIIAQAARFPFAQHERAHESVLKTLRFLRDEMTGKNGLWNKESAENYAEILSDWLTNHILVEDMLMKPLLQTYPYDFKPSGCHPEFM